MTDSRCYLLGAEVGQDINSLRGFLHDTGKKTTDPEVIGQLQGLRIKLEKSGCLTREEANRFFSHLTRNLLSEKLLTFPEVVAEPLAVPVGEKGI